MQDWSKVIKGHVQKLNLEVRTICIVRIFDGIRHSSIHDACARFFYTREYVI